MIDHLEQDIQRGQFILTAMQKDIPIGTYLLAGLKWPLSVPITEVHYYDWSVLVQKTLSHCFPNDDSFINRFIELGTLSTGSNAQPLRSGGLCSIKEALSSQVFFLSNICLVALRRMCIPVDPQSEIQAIAYEIADTKQRRVEVFGTEKNRKKKYQVFVSSTFLDLKEERQAAVEAILKLGHIPAGMELFAASNRSQMEVIRKWIDESDIYMLILGFKYGSLDEASKTSYTELEFDYAVSRGKPFFAVVMDEQTKEARVRAKGLSIIESKYEEKLRAFRGKVINNHLVRFFGSKQDIQLATHESIHHLIDEYQPIGWIHASENTGDTKLAEEILHLRNENMKLRQEKERLKDAAGPARENGCKERNIRLQVQHRAQEGKVDSRAIAEVFGMSKNWVSSRACKKNSLGRPILERMLNHQGKPLTFRDGRFHYRLDRVLEFVDALEKWVASPARENVSNGLPLWSAKDERIVTGQFLQLQTIVGKPGMPASGATVKKRLAPPAAFCISSAGQGYSLLYPAERLDLLREGATAPRPTAP